MRLLTQILGILFLAVLAAGCDVADPSADPPAMRRGRGATISVEVLGEVSVVEMNRRFSSIGVVFTARFPVVEYRVLYETVDARGKVALASGAIVAPVPALGPLPLVSYQHGTSVRRTAVPSLNGDERIVGLAFASTGYLAALPDYLGLGNSPGLHPYVHAATSSSAVVDMMRATVDFAAAHGLELAQELFLVGYSQGGYTTMAAHRALEADHADEFTVTASAPMAGPYDLSGVMASVVTEHRPYPSPYYVPYVLLSYNAVYGLYESPSAFLRSPYDVLIPPLFDGTHSGSEINALLPDIPREMLQPEWLSSFENDPDNVFRQRLRENDLYDWVPRAPVRLFHCAGDEIVPKENSEIALRHLSRGSASITLTDPLPIAGHGICAPLSILLAKYWFDSF